MKATRFFRQFTSAVLLSLIAGTLGNVALAQPEQPVRRAFLLHLPCADGDGKSYNNFRRSNAEISVNREYYEAVMEVKPGGEMSCGLRTDTPATLELEFGMRDSDRGSAPVIVTLFLDGFQIDSQTVAPGQTRSILADVTNVRSIAIETACTKPINCGSPVYFTKAELTEIPLFIQQQ
ncbi:MAG: hypothetical protein SAL07_18230 [Oscillatoria sp. PMC 1051.18]|uniref:hypothetical protein n=1 Tax=Oscillatoria salina TaxID=331517 RepID=UPI0013BD3652|nr:hypothetical protein [Oscillatoria salina]MBZ8179302.1 hypothetical protein [Oscillatoria salina IIICB1]MEC4894390.1 hypothetical protein [Oscillatoria sp. PMC 1050.18]MEC5031842.1 hypothetical protein [Oscillatoria sp. PMC 1051.18]NET86730.1 hypothetical protein [Kamptonema sp. SIO1D9]